MLAGPGFRLGSIVIQDEMLKHYVSTNGPLSEKSSYSRWLLYSLLVQDPFNCSQQRIHIGIGGM